MSRKACLSATAVRQLRIHVKKNEKSKNYIQKHIKIG